MSRDGKWNCSSAFTPEQLGAFNTAVASAIKKALTMNPLTDEQIDALRESVVDEVMAVVNKTNEPISKKQNRTN